MAQTPRRVFFLIYDQVEILDLAGAYDVFTIANIASGERAFELHTVSPTKGAIGPMRHPAQPDRGLHLEAMHTQPGPQTVRAGCAWRIRRRCRSRSAGC